jgi:hypothetical protein
MEAIRSSETSVLIRATRRHLPDDDNHHVNIFLRRDRNYAYKYVRNVIQTLYTFFVMYLHIKFKVLRSNVLLVSVSNGKRDFALPAFCYIVFSKIRLNQNYISLKICYRRKSQDHTLAVRSRDSAVGKATGYGLDDRGVGVRAPVGPRIFSSPRRPDRLWGPPNLLSNGYRGCFPRG